MSSNGATSSYLELASQTYSLFVDAYVSANQRALEYAKHVVEIGTRPYGASTVEAAFRENFERTTEVMTLSIAELQTSGQKTAELAEKLAAQAAKLQESYSGALRGLVDTGISNMNFAKDTAAAQFEGFTKRMDDIQKTATAATVSAN
jgi:broad specificity phosphatase PhoE